MDIENFNMMNADLYRVVMMLIEGLTLLVALASLMFVLVAIGCAGCDLLGETGDYPRRKIRARSRRLVRFHAGLSHAVFTNRAKSMAHLRGALDPGSR